MSTTQHKTRVNDARGFTLIELLIALIITSIIVLAGFTILTTSNKATRANTQTVATQSNVRSAMELMSRDLKMAGFGMTGPVGNCPTAIVPSDNTPAGADSGPDAVSMVVPAVSNANAQWVLSAQAAAPANQIQLSSAHVSDMATLGLANGSVVSLGGAFSVQVTAVNAGTGVITLAAPIVAPAVFPAKTTTTPQGPDTPVYLLQCVTYQVIRPPDTNNVCAGNAPCLVRGVPAAANNCDVAASPCIPIVDGIEDLQLAYACDGCVSTINGGVPDGTIDDQPTTPSGFDVSDFVTNSTWATPPLTPDKVRLIQLSIVARQTATDVGMGDTNAAGTFTAAPLQVSDHNAAADTGYYNAAQYQQQRRRVLVRTISTRNMGL